MRAAHSSVDRYAVSAVPRWLAPAAVAVPIVAVVLAWSLDRPPAPLPADAPADVFSAQRAHALLERIAVAPRMTGSEEHARARALLVRELESLGFDVGVQQTTAVRESGRFVRAATVRNIVARKRGSASSGGIALVSHYDSQQLTPGAADAGAGVAAILEAVRALSSGSALRNDLYVVFTDAEELDRLGADAFIREHAWWSEIDVLLNFEARGSSGASVMFETNAGNGWVVRQLEAADPYPVASSLYYEVYRRLPNDSDFSSFKEAGAIGMNFAFAEGADDYHRPTDTVENISLASLQHHGEHALALARHLGDLDLEPASTAPDLVYFRLPALGLVSYPAAWTLPLLAAAVGFAGVVAWRGFVRGSITPFGALAGLAGTLGALAVAAGLAWLVREAAGRAHHEAGLLAGRWLYDEHAYALAVACIALASVAGAFAALRRSFTTASLAAGALLIPLSGAIAATLYAPGTSMTVTWPAVLMTASIAWLAGRARERAHHGLDLAAAAALCIPMTLLYFPLVWAVYIGLSIAAAPVLAAALVVMLATWLPLIDLATRRDPWLLSGSALGLGAALMVLGVVQSRPSLDRPLLEGLAYIADHDSGTAFFATRSPAGGRWLPQFFGTEAPRVDAAGLLPPGADYRLASAPALARPAPSAAITADAVTAEGLRTVRIEIRSGFAFESVTVFPLPDAGIQLRAINGTGIDTRSSTDGAEWRVQHFGRPLDGALVLDVVSGGADAPLGIVVVETAMRLPELPGLERPPGVAPPSRQLTDVARYRRTFRFE